MKIHVPLIYQLYYSAGYRELSFVWKSATSPHLHPTPTLWEVCANWGLEFISTDFSTSKATGLIVILFANFVKKGTISKGCLFPPQKKNRNNVLMIYKRKLPIGAEHLCIWFTSTSALRLHNIIVCESKCMSNLFKWHKLWANTRKWCCTLTKLRFC